jgi:glycerophosphoryl diester phosphodiesterase
MPIINYNAKSWERHSPLFESYLNCNLDILAYEICWNGTLKGERKIFKRVTDTSSRLWVNTMWDKLCGGDKHGFEDDRALNGNEHKVYGKLIKYGVRMIQTDRPELLINYLESRGHHTLP